MYRRVRVSRVSLQYKVTIRTVDQRNSPPETQTSLSNRKPPPGVHYQMISPLYQIHIKSMIHTIINKVTYINLYHHVRLSVCPGLCLEPGLSVCPGLCLEPVCLSVLDSVYNLSVCLSWTLFITWSVCLSWTLFRTCLSVLDSV